MPIVIVPDGLYDAIQKKLDAAIAERPDAERDRDHLYHRLLDYYYEHGAIPDFSLVKVVP